MGYLLYRLQKSLAACEDFILLVRYLGRSQVDVAHWR